ncbi:hypothetical protein FJTKL_10156 [Diaporthe vaccinii]|uniref:Uncharacterized protein n=1 Tax=Diaporthe vaccinii TaxID=105482 RepID=A0ABR4EKS4_9PEZI
MRRCGNFSRNVSDSHLNFLFLFPEFFSAMSSLFNFVATLSILRGLGGLFAGGTINFLVLSRPSRTPFACQRAKFQKTAVTTGLDRTCFTCLDPDVGIVCRISVLGEMSFSQDFECGGGVCLCSVSPSLPVRIRTAWWYSLLLSLTFLIDTSIQTPYHCTHSFTLRSSLRVFDYIHSDAIRITDY